jgi:hypothetical protein
MKDRQFYRVKYWVIIADNLRKVGWSWSCVSAVDSRGRTIWIADGHRDDGKRQLSSWPPREPSLAGKAFFAQQA